MSEQILSAKIEFGELKAEFEGDFETVSREIMKFLSEISPAFSTLSKIKLETDFEQLVKDLEDVLKVAKEGPLLLVPRGSLSGPEIICLYLVGAYVGYKLGIMEKDSMSVDELSQLTGIKKTVVRVRLSEMGRSRIVASANKGERRITGIGIEYFRSAILPKLK